MKKLYIAPEMEILESELEGFLAASATVPHYEPGQGKNLPGGWSIDAHGQDGDFESEDDYEYEY